MISLEAGWSLDVERGPDWLFVRLHAPADDGGETMELAESLWQLLEQHFVHRMVLELDQVPVLRSRVIGQLILLHKRMVTHGGLLRLCGLSENNVRVLRALRMDDRFPAYTDRGAAVMGQRPASPR